SKLRELFEYCRKLELLVTVHAEDDPLIEELAEKQGDAYAGPEMHPKLRPAEAEYRAVSYICALAKEVGIPIYIVHLSSAKGLQAVREARDSGADVHVETTPHYLLLENSLLSLSDAPKYVMTPPLREKKDNTALWEAVAGNEIAVIATDHCAFTEEQKLSSQDCRSIFPGIPGTEEMLPLIHTHGVVKGLFDLQRMTDLLSRTPAEIFGLYPRKGSLHPGSDADIIIFDPEEEWTIRKETEHTKAGYTPYQGSKVTGRVKKTFLRGELLVSENEYFGKRGAGHFLKASPSSVWSKIKP
ncbi:MAG: amidohydrolase family protein, partial [Spirochaetia bacterium]|nr:amidohydrolase family protein [Spirochaetia bacterium]